MGGKGAAARGPPDRAGRPARPADARAGRAAHHASQASPDAAACRSWTLHAAPRTNASRGDIPVLIVLVNPP
jgi:hypothetical protein